MAFNTLVNGTVIDAVPLMQNFELSINNELLTRIDQLIDRDVIRSNDKIGPFVEAYTSAAGRKASVDTANTDCSLAFDSQIYDSASSNSLSTKWLRHSTANYDATHNTNEYRVGWTSSTTGQKRGSMIKAQKLNTPCIGLSLDLYWQPINSGNSSSWTNTYVILGENIVNYNNAGDGLRYHPGHGIIELVKGDSVIEIYNNASAKLTNSTYSSIQIILNDNVLIFIKDGTIVCEIDNIPYKITSNTFFAFSGYDSSGGFGGQLRVKNINEITLTKYIFDNTGEIHHTIPSGTFLPTVSKGIAAVKIVDWEDGASLQWKATNATEDTGWKDFNIDGETPYAKLSSFTAFTSEPDTFIVKLIPKTTSPTAGVPSISGAAIQLGD